MFTKLHLQRIDRPALENRAIKFSVLLCLFLWSAIGGLIKIHLDEWYGFSMGIFVAMAISVFFMWLIYARPSARKKRLIQASFANSEFRVYDPITENAEKIVLSKPHKAILVVSKTDMQFILRLEQTTGGDRTRFDMLGELPLACPMRTDGDMASLLGFISRAQKRSATNILYRIKHNNDAPNTPQSILEFIERHNYNRDNDTTISKGDKNIIITGNHFKLQTRDRLISFTDNNTVELAVKADHAQTSSKNPHEDTVSTARIYMALCPPEGNAYAIVFSVVAPLGWVHDLPREWNIPESAMDTHFALYDDSINTARARKILKRYIKQTAPNNHVLDLLRH